MTPATSTSTILDDCTQQESIPDASTAKNQKPSPKQDELYVAIGDEKDILLLLYKKRDHKLVTQEDRKELKSCEKKLVDLEEHINKLRPAGNDRNCLEIIANVKWSN